VRRVNLEKGMAGTFHCSKFRTMSDNSDVSHGSDANRTGQQSPTNPSRTEFDYLITEITAAGTER
jgi:hypothetical protein